MRIGQRLLTTFSRVVLIGLLSMMIAVPSGAFAATPVAAFDPPPVTTSPSSFDLSSAQGGIQTVSLTVNVGNIAGLPPQAYTMPAAWSVSHSFPWLTLNPSSGSATLNSSFSVQITVNTAGLQPGNYQDSINVDVSPPAIPTFSSLGGARLRTMANGQAVVPVNLTVGAGGSVTVSLSPSPVTFNGVAGATSPASKTMNVSVEGSESLGWTVSDDASWLMVSPASGSGDGTLTLMPHTGGLAPGTYESTITLTAAGASNSPVTAKARLVLAPGESHPTTLTIGAGATRFLWQNGTWVRGTLTHGRSAVTGKPLRLEYSMNGSTGWTRVANVTAGAAFAVRPATARYYRFVFTGDSSYAASTSRPLRLVPTVYLGSPTFVGTYWPFGGYVTIFGDLRPRHTAGRVNVWVTMQRYESGRWVTKAVIPTTNANGASATSSRYSVRTRLLLKGSWRMFATYRATAAYPVSTSGYRYFVVR